MKLIIYIIVLVMVSSCVTTPIEVENTYNNSYKNVYIDNITLNDFLETNQPSSSDGNILYYRFDTKKNIEINHKVFETQEDSTICFNNGKLESFTLGTQWIMGDTISAGSIITLYPDSARIARIYIGEGTTINGYKILKDSFAYFYNIGYLFLAYFVPSHGFNDFGFNIAGGYPVYIFENKKLACAVLSTDNELYADYTKIYAFKSGLVRKWTLRNEFSNEVITVPKNTLFSVNNNGKFESFTVKYEVDIGSPYGILIANSRVFINIDRNLVRYTISRSAYEDIDFGENSELIFYENGNFAKNTQKDDNGNSVPVYHYENGHIMHYTDYNSNNPNRYFNIDGTILTEQNDIDRIKEKISLIDNMYIDIDWEWSGYESLYKFHEN